MTTLYTAYAGELSLGQALVRAGVEEGCALLTSPTAYRIARVHGDGCRTSDGEVDLTPVFEARVFTPHVELRWVESGRAVLLTEEEHRLPSGFPGRLDPMEVLTTLPAHYLVWGQVAASEKGWVRLRDRQVGTVVVPMADGAADAVRLSAREYVVADPDHGNAHVAEERLIEFQAYSAEGAA